MRRGLLLDCDGVLTEIEIEGHLEAFNRVWQEDGVAWQWTRQEYLEALSISGGHERLMALAGCPAFIAAAGPLSRFGDWRETTLGWHRRKTKILAERLRHGPVYPRPGIRGLACSAHAAGWRIAVVSAGAPETVHVVARSVLGPSLYALTLVVTGQDVAAKKPAPDAYQVALDRLGLEPSAAVAIEDSPQGLAAAHGAGVPCLVFPTASTVSAEFPDALAVVPNLLAPSRDWQCRDAPTIVGPLSVEDLELLSTPSLEPTEL